MTKEPNDKPRPEPSGPDLMYVQAHGLHFFRESPLARLRRLLRRGDGLPPERR